MHEDEFEGMGEQGQRLQVSFAGMQVLVPDEPELREEIYLVVGGHVSQLKEPNKEDGNSLSITVKGQAQRISAKQYFDLVGVNGAEEVEG